MAGYRGQGCLVKLITFYRRHLSGRGPFRFVVCTFFQTESCSAYGLRVSRRVATSLPMALSLIRRRLRRCREAGLYRRPSGWAWAGMFDVPDELSLLKSLEADHELPQTAASLLRSRALVAEYCGDWPVADACTNAAMRLCPKPAFVVIRNGNKLYQSLLHSCYVQCAFLGVCVLASLLIPLPGPISVSCIATATFLSLCSFRRYFQKRRRFEFLDAAGRFDICLRR